MSREEMIIKLTAALQLITDINPKAEFDKDENGQIVIYTGITVTDTLEDFVAEGA